jgi:hypothetical protein
MGNISIVQSKRTGLKRLRFKPSRILNRLIEEGKPIELYLCFDGKKLCMKEKKDGYVCESFPVVVSEENPAENPVRGSFISSIPKEKFEEKPAEKPVVVLSYKPRNTEPESLL